MKRLFATLILAVSVSAQEPPKTVRISTPEAIRRLAVATVDAQDVPCTQQNLIKALRLCLETQGGTGLEGIEEEWVRKLLANCENAR